MQVADPWRNSVGPPAPEHNCRRALTRARTSRRVHRGFPGSKGGVAIPCLHGPDPVFTPDVNMGSQEVFLQRRGNRGC
jgi:hypothetical protein